MRKATTMSDANKSQGDLSSMTSMARWLQDTPQSNVHDRLVSGTSPGPQHANKGSRVPQDQPGQKTSDTAAYSPLGLEEEVGGPGEIAPGAPSSSTETHKNAANLRRGSTTSSVWIRVLGEAPREGYLSRFTAWVSGSHRSHDSQSKVPSPEGPSLPEQPPDTIFQTLPNRIEKRLRGRKGTNKSDSEEEKRSHSAKKQRTTVEGKKERFACPFYQRNPDNNRYPSCSGPGFDTIHRVKGHLKQNHWFQNEPELQGSHRPRRPTERVSLSQANALHGLRKLVHGKDRAEKWQTVYCILFPNDTDIPCAFVKPNRTDASGRTLEQTSSNRDLTGFKRFVSEKASHYVARQLENPNEPTTAAMGQEEMARMTNLFQKFMTGLLDEYFQDATALVAENEVPEQEKAHEAGSALKETPKAKGPDHMNISRMQPPQLPPVPNFEPVSSIGSGLSDNTAARDPKVTQDLWSDSFVQKSATLDDPARLDVEGVLDIYSNNPPQTVNPGALSTITSEMESSQYLTFSSVRPSNPEHQGGSFTTAPPREAKPFGDESAIDYYIDPRLWDDPEFVGSDSYSFTYAPERDVDGVRMDKNSGGYDSVDPTNNTMFEDSEDLD